jgi:hypothetical protein
MTLIPKSSPSQHQEDDGEWLTKSQLAKINNGTKADIEALVKLGYLTSVRLGPRMNRFWSTDAKNAINAFRNNENPPTPTKLARKPIDWRA